MTAKQFAPDGTALRWAGALAMIAGIASWWTTFWVGLTVALAALVLGGVLARWGEFRRTSVHRGRSPVIAVVAATVGWSLFVTLEVLRARSSGVALGTAMALAAWTPGRPQDLDKDR